VSLSGTLWGDAPDERAMASLRSALWRLRRAGLPIIDSIGEHVVLSPLVDVDLYELTSVARALLDGNQPRNLDAVDRLANADELLGDWYDEWLLVERERFRQLRLQALEQIALDLAAAGRYGHAAESALAAIAAEPLRESAHRALIRVHLAQGNFSEAVRQYARFRDLIREELDLEPSSQMDELLGTPLVRAAPAPIDEPEASLA
jgi:DNA-binding SARP family transcriptional activator